ncbi:glycerophosphodiester phosphodiesterase [Ruania zhangjianzhongii]|uniref:glycerophosphodiester phosphodiesterase n=1 Tax=Ruania zhangjianzhongii TaxID=2603206 RepID=UPI001651F45F|nr:glycerophosphodiester phosphodiesterase family protein [Ruania zhangjianzhongii]
MAVCAENTLASFDRATRDGAVAIELDVRLSVDARLVVIHDAAVDRTAVAGRRQGVVAELTWAELQQVELGEGQRIPSLEAALGVVRTEVHVEIKDPAAALQAAELVLREDLQDRVMLTSFDVGALAEVRRRSTRLRLGVICTEPTAAALAAVRQLDAAALAAGSAHLDPELTGRLQSAGVQVCGWPVRTEGELAQALAAGVDLVTADDPAWCRERLAALAGAEV